MLRAVMALLIVGCGGGAGALRLTMTAPAADTSWIVDDVSTIRSLARIGSEVVENRMVRHRRSQRTAVIVEGTLLVRVAVRYEVDDSRLLDGAQETVEQGVLAGKHYEVWRDRDALEAQHADGSPITAAERAALNKEFAGLGATSTMETFIVGRAWRRDEIVELPGDVAAERVPVDADLSSATIAWTGQAGSLVTFRIALAYQDADGFAIQGTEDLRFDRVTGLDLGYAASWIRRGTLGGQEVEQHVDTVRTIE